MLYTHEVLGVPFVKTDVEKGALLLPPSYGVLHDEASRFEELVEQLMARVSVPVREGTHNASAVCVPLVSEDEAPSPQGTIRAIKQSLEGRGHEHVIVLSPPSVIGVDMHQIPVPVAYHLHIDASIPLSAVEVVSSPLGSASA